jgi:hypothetical protein
MKLLCVLAAATAVSAWVAKPALPRRAAAEVSKPRRLAGGLKHNPAVKIANDITELIGNTPMVRLTKVGVFAMYIYV